MEPNTKRSRVLAAPPLLTSSSSSLLSRSSSSLRLLPSALVSHIYSHLGAMDHFALSLTCTALRRSSLLVTSSPIAIDIEHEPGPSPSAGGAVSRVRVNAEEESTAVVGEAQG